MLLLQCHVPLHLSPKVVSIILKWQVWLIQDKDNNTTLTLWRYPHSYYACMVILNATRLEILSWSFWVFRLGDPSILHSTVNFFYVILITKDELEIAHLVAVDSSHAVFSCNMKNILNLSFHWEDKLIELLGFHSLQYSLSLVLIEALIQSFSSFSQEYKGFLCCSQAWHHPHLCMFQRKQEETDMQYNLDLSAQKSFHCYILWDSVLLSHMALEIS